MPMYHDDYHVKLCDGTVIWDGINRPDNNDNGPVWNLKVAFRPDNSDVLLLQGIYQQLAQQHRVPPPTPDREMIKVLGPDVFEGRFNGWLAIRFKTSRGLPEVYDEQGSLLTYRDIPHVIYPGQQVSIVASCYHYSNKTTGISAGLDGIGVILSAQAPILRSTANSLDVAAAFAPAQAPIQQQQPYVPSTAPVQQPSQGQQPYVQMPATQPYVPPQHSSQQPYAQAPMQQPQQPYAPPTTPVQQQPSQGQQQYVVPPYNTNNK